jgi:hypothetical protein
MQNFSARRGRAKFTNCTPAVAMFSLISVLFLAGPLRGQELSDKTSTLFDNIQRNLDLAVDSQLALAQIPNPPHANASPHGAATLKFDETWPTELPLGNSSSTETQSSEQRFRAMGVDARKVFNEEGVPIALISRRTGGKQFQSHGPFSQGGSRCLATYACDCSAVRIAR